MKKIIIGFILALSSLLLVNTRIEAQKVAEYQCKWHEGRITGQEEDLVNLMQYDEKSRILFLIFNDDKNLYADVVLADKTVIQKIMRFGLTTWMNPEGKHKKTMGIRFPVSSDGQNDQPMMRGKGTDRKEMQMAMMAAKNREMVLVGFGGGQKEQVIDPGQDSLFYGRVEMMEGGKLHISLALPLEELDRGNAETMLQSLSLGFETGYLDLTRQGGMQTGSGSQGGGGGQMHGGGMPGGGPPSGGPPSGGMPGSAAGSEDQQRQPQADISELAKPSRLWINRVMLSKGK